MWLFAEFFPELLSFFQRLHKRFDVRSVFVTLVVMVILYHAFIYHYLLFSVALFICYILYMKIKYIDNSQSSKSQIVINSRLHNFKEIRYLRIKNIRKTRQQLITTKWNFKISDECTIKLQLDENIHDNKGSILYINDEFVENQDQAIWLYFLGKVFYAKVTDMDGNDFIIKVKLGGFFKAKISLTIKQLS